MECKNVINAINEIVNENKKGKIPLDKYYTPTDLAEYCVMKTKEIIGSENIVEYLEPSAGSGVFLPCLDKKYLAFDIEPEDKGVTKQNYLELELPYLKGRCVIGNPPYGKGNYTSVKFFKKAITQGDYVSFILPISQLNNNMYMYEFDMVHSEDLGKREYSGRKVHCVLNIYKRNKNGYNKKPNYDLKDVSLRGVSTGKGRNDKIPNKYNFSVCAFGDIGVKANNNGRYCQQMYITINNDKYIKKITDIILNTKWQEHYGMTGTPVLKQWMVYKRLKSLIPELT